MSKLAIFDYGAGNLFSLESSMRKNGAKQVSIIRDMDTLDEFDGLVLPGVGNFDPAIISLEPFRRTLEKASVTGTPILGICLGMEMFLERSEEGKLNGLKLLKGYVKMLDKKKVKVPHIGWNNLNITNSSSKLLSGVPNESWVYFVHSYRIVSQEKEITMASTEYGTKFPVVIEKGNVFGTQFHPEKSGAIGEKIIRNFIGVCIKSK
ncbi:MAG: imidazole glycerol phosphate synthase subunit HisH [Nitrososphaeraceae archaeon]|nr:imidazole glycerol phosphate synthase subunit HisH [Nitrososphaeraceae archaeon]